MRLRAMLIFCGLAAVAAAAPATLAQPAAVDRPAEVRGGTCDSLGEVMTTLAHLVITVGDPQGQLAATPVEQSGTVVPFAVADFLASDHAVVVQRSPQESALVACGEVGGALNPDGTLAVGMRAMNGSGLSGVAYFTPIDTFANTLVTILLVDNSAPNTTTTTVDGATSLDDSGTNPQ